MAPCAGRLAEPPLCCMHRVPFVCDYTLCLNSKALQIRLVVLLPHVPQGCPTRRGDGDFAEPWSHVPIPSPSHKTSPRFPAELHTPGRAAHAAVPWPRGCPLVPAASPALLGPPSPFVRGNKGSSVRRGAAHASPRRRARVPARHKAALFARAAAEVWSQPARGAWHGAAFSSRPSLAFSFSFGLLWLFALAFCTPIFGAWWLQGKLRRDVRLRLLGTGSRPCPLPSPSPPGCPLSPAVPCPLLPSLSPGPAVPSQGAAGRPVRLSVCR